MPLVRISLVKGKSREHIRAISDGIHRGLIEAYGAPEDDKFQLVHQHERDELIYDADYLGLHRTDDLVGINIARGTGARRRRKRRSSRRSPTTSSRIPDCVRKTC